jgi:hypothetical protein
MTCFHETTKLGRDAVEVYDVHAEWQVGLGERFLKGGKLHQWDLARRFYSVSVRSRDVLLKP